MKHSMLHIPRNYSDKFDTKEMCLHIYWAEQNIDRTIETLIRQCSFRPLLWAGTTIKEQQKLVTMNSFAEISLKFEQGGFTIE